MVRGEARSPHPRFLITLSGQSPSPERVFFFEASSRINSDSARCRAAQNADAIAQRIGGQRVNGASVEILCDPSEKMEQLRRIAALGDAVADLEMTPPRLEDLYRHYAKEDLQ